ncbi:DUF4190 domain-containing protein [Aneurinibacillus sp. Ricciae_BoGa-3]|uniref:DUF4190 domain-containing protein n=1 Tax=Aneurinibacillus sp. Ricciae_BoGa-3 TaxID=3022697 RepID=UPI0023411B40|nr:DUF4190 domain-containing protein [Aneurinibacillus sp. Ricciae_BoGa-3]WCK55806.1 DUF4190 domain-containing protein [Aneurinibacillus sp. Ricciae_BoGa-3]
MDKGPQDDKYREETASELAPHRPSPVQFGKNDTPREDAGGKGLGTVALILSILSFFIMPYLFGVAGLVLGFFAAKRGGKATGRWAIYLAIAAMVLPLFIRPWY